MRPSETKVTGGCESPDVSAGNQTLVLWKWSKQALLAAEPSPQPHESNVHLET